MPSPAIVHREEILLAAAPELVKTFVLTPERILDYYPGGKDCGVFEAGRSFYCRGKSGVSLLELDEPHSDETTIVLKVTTSLKAKPPYSPQKIIDDVFFTMHEDWKIEPNGTGSKLTKTWRDVKKYQMKFMPMKFIVKRSAKQESAVLTKAWDKAAATAA